MIQAKPKLLTLEVSEIFISIQGEGKFLGKPSLFIRLRRCNLACPKCDEKHTWDKSDPDYNKFETYATEELWKVIVRNFPGYFNIVISGGEPMLWQRQLSEFIEQVPEAISIEVETNGTIIPSTLVMQRNRVHYNVSPKLISFHNNLDRITQRPECLRWFAERAAVGNAIFKFVVSQGPDIFEITQLISTYNIPPDSVYLMPEGRTRDEVLEKLPWMFELCKNYRLNLTPRLHILAFDNQKGT